MSWFAQTASIAVGVAAAWLLVTTVYESSNSIGTVWDKIRDYFTKKA